MIRRILVLVSLIGLFVMLWPVVITAARAEEPSRLGAAYVERSVEELQAANVVTAVIVTYRGLDTLGEVTVLFAAAAVVGFVMATGSPHRDRSVGIRDKSADPTNPQQPSELLQTASSVLVPLLMLFGAFVFVHGHLTPGGGFQGGVVLAAALVLRILSYPASGADHGVLGRIESTSGFVYVLLGALGIVLGRGFLDPTFLPTGTIGQLFSAGAIPLIYTVIGLKVGTELTGVVTNLQHSRTQEVSE